MVAQYRENLESELRDHEEMKGSSNVVTVRNENVPNKNLIPLKAQIKA